ncbi:MAG: sulfotransferase, partial [bacterium]|nr:sulfotransferase [bacterium]
ISNYSERYPRVSAIPLIHRLHDLPVIGDRLKKRIIHDKPSALIPWPHEGDAIYHDYAGFGQTVDGIERELTDEMQRRLKEKISGHLRLTGKPRFLSKQTANNRRVGLLDKMFPDALYVHAIRDGRAVASSTLRVPWWNDTHIWWLGYKASQWQEEGRPPIELSARYWMRTVQEVRRHRELLGDRYMEIRYEDLARDTRGVIGEITRVCALRQSAAFTKRIPSTLPGMNYKWKEQLTDTEKATLQECIGEFLDELGYVEIDEG